jgi:hypothetical protein
MQSEGNTHTLIRTAPGLGQPPVQFFEPDELREFSMFRVRNAKLPKEAIRYYFAVRDEAYLTSEFWV